VGRREKGRGRGEEEGGWRRDGKGERKPLSFHHSKQVGACREGMAVAAAHYKVKESAREGREDVTVHIPKLQIHKRGRESLYGQIEPVV
jgi:hypothetical protein